MQHRGGVLGAAAVAVIFGLVGLSGCSSPPAPDQPAGDTRPTPAATYATTGRTVPEGRTPRAVLAVKVDDTAAGRPQQGVAEADLVVQEPVEGGLTRLMAFFESKRPDSVGPVRSVRTTDLPLVLPLNATMVASGGSPASLSAFAAAGVTLVDESDDAFVRNPQRLAPYNLYVDTTALGGGPKARPARDLLLAFGDFEFPPGRDVTQVELTFSPAAADSWGYSGSGGWRRTGDERAFSADNLLILGVRLRDTGLRDAAGSAVPEVVVTAKGAGFLLTGKTVHVIRWRKASAEAPYRLTTKDGLVVSVPPGKTWIALLPKDGGKVSFM